MSTKDSEVQLMLEKQLRELNQNMNELVQVMRGVTEALKGVADIDDQLLEFTNPPSVPIYRGGS